MADFWGPAALDGELAYRRERLTNELHNRRSAHAAVTPAVDMATSHTGTANTPVASAHPRLSAARGWLLRGSRTWHVAH